MAGLHLSEELGRQYETEEDIDRKSVEKIQLVGAQRLATIGDPGSHNEIRVPRYAQEIQTETEEPLGIEIVDDGNYYNSASSNSDETKNPLWSFSRKAMSPALSTHCTGKEGFGKSPIQANASEKSPVATSNHRTGLRSFRPIMRPGAS